MRSKMSSILVKKLVLVANCFALLTIISNDLEKLGVNCDTFTSTYARLDPPSTDMPLDSPVFASPKGYNAPEQVHLTQGDYDGKAIIISWVTPIKAGDSTVYYGPTSAKYNKTAQGTVTSYEFKQYKSGFIHHCLVDGLEYNTKYYYKIGNGSSTREFWFKTPPPLGLDASYTFGIIGGLGQTNNSLSTLKHYMESGGEAVLFVGDLTYADRHNDVVSEVGLRWDTWGRFVEPSNAYQPWIWSAGNHDIECFPDFVSKIPLSVPNFHRVHRHPVPKP